MNRKDKIAQDINDLLPDSSSLLGSDGLEARTSLVNQKASSLHEKRTARELARVQYNLRVGREAEAAKAAVTKYKEEKKQAQEEAIQQLEAEDASMPAEKAIEIGNQVAALHGQPTVDMASKTAQSILALQGTTRPEVVRLLTSLNVNLNLQLTKTDTANLLACLLTANETQLNAIYKNKKVPVAVKTVIKRLLDDAKLGNIETVEKLWDRIFGKAGMMLNLPEQTQIATGIIPNTPVSREAYVIIRDTLLR